MNKIAILYTTFLRDELMYKTIQSIVNNYTENCILLIGDQNATDAKENILSSIRANYYDLSYDCGLSYSRNYLVERARELNCEYCLLSADSLELNQSLSDLNVIIDFMNSDENIGIVGLKINNRVKWNWNITLEKEFFDLTKATDIKNFKDLEFTKCQVVSNFFLARTQCLLENKWDNELKLLEHEDFFYRLSQTHWKVYASEFYKCNYINDKPNSYKIMRDRMYTEFKHKLQLKYNITGWIREER